MYTAQAHTIGGSDVSSGSDDGRLKLALSIPGGVGAGTNPEQLFAAGYFECFLSAMKAVAGMKKSFFLRILRSMPKLIWVKPAVAVMALLPVWTSAMPGMDAAAAHDLIDTAHHVCPYSKAMRGSIDVTLTFKPQTQA